MKNIEYGCGGSNLGPLRPGHSPRNGRAIGQSSLALWCHEASILTPWSLGLFMLGLLVQFSSIQLLSRVQLFATPWPIARQASLSITNFQSLPKLMSIESVMPSNHLILFRPLLLLPSVFPSIRVCSNESLCPPNKLFGTWRLVYNWFVLKLIKYSLFSSLHAALSLPRS